MSSKSVDMCHGPLLKKIILYTLPITLSGVLQLLFNAADLVIVGQLCSSKSVAAVGATGALTTLIVNLFIGISTGTGVTVAHAIGSHDRQGVRRAVHTAIPTALICGGIVSIAGFFLSKPLLNMMNTPKDILELSALYMKIYFSGMVFNMVFNFGAAMLRAAGDTKSPLIFLTMSGFLNVCLNVIFVTIGRTDKTGVAGVALATTLSQVLCAILVVITLMRRKDACKLSFKHLQIHKKTLSKILRIGIPSGIQSSLFAISNVIIQSAVNSFGSAATAGNAAATSIEGFAYQAMTGFYQSSLNFSGQNEGAKKYKRIKKTFIICACCSASIGLLISTVLYIFRQPLLSIYIKDSAEAIAFGEIKLLFVGLPYFLCGLMEASTGSVRGMGSSLAPMLITVIGVCGFRVGWTYTIFQLPSFHTPSWLFASYPISWIISFTGQTILFAYLYRKRINSQKIK